MAGEYLQFAVEMPVENYEQYKWLRDQIHAFNNAIFDDDFETEDMIAQGICPSLRKYLQEHSGEASEVQYEGRFDSTTDEKWVLLYSDTFGNPESAAKIIAAYQEMFDDEERIQLTWAEWSDKMRPGAFGGGECIIQFGVIHYPDGALSAWRRNLGTT